jgi:hypothetical protein
MNAFDTLKAETIAIVTPVCEMQILRGWVGSVESSPRSFAKKASSSGCKALGVGIGFEPRPQHETKKSGGGLRRRIEVRTY